MPKGQKAWNRGHMTWTVEQDAYLQELCATTLSYTGIRDKFNERFPEATKTRNAMLGRATRQGYRASKPLALGFGQTKAMQEARHSNRRVRRKVALAEGEARPTFNGDDCDMLRAEGDRGDAATGTGRKMSILDPEVIRRKQGNLPSVIEANPLTSVPVCDVENGACMWPTNPEATEVCGATAKVGSYCVRHAQAAYRVMPTRKRQAVRLKEDTEYRQRIDGAQHRDKLDPDGEWLNRALMELDEVTIDGVDEGNHPLFIPHFLGTES